MEVVKLIYNDNLKLGCLKCEFITDKVEVLGHIIANGKAGKQGGRWSSGGSGGSIKIIKMMTHYITF